MLRKLSKTKENQVFFFGFLTCFSATKADFFVLFFGIYICLIVIFESAGMPSLLKALLRDFLHWLPVSFSSCGKLLAIIVCTFVCQENMSQSVTNSHVFIFEKTI
jgi:hypothetical protein